MRLTLVAGIAVVLLAGPAPTDEPAGAGGLRRQAAYSGLWPFYSHEELEDGSKSWTSLLGAVRVETEPDGDWHHHLLPFYCASLAEGGRDRQLGLYPLFYLRRRSPEKSYDAVLPFFSSWKSGEARHTLLWPFFQIATNPETGPFRWIPTLFRHGSWEEEDESRDRLGLPLIFEIFEHSHARDHDAWTVANLFNFGREAQSGLPLARHRYSGDGTYESHLFPLYFAGKDSETTYFHTPLACAWTSERGFRGIVLPPLLTWAWWKDDGYAVHAPWPLVLLKDTSEEGRTHLFPFYFAGESYASSRRYRFYSLFYGSVEDGAGATCDRYFPLLLSHHGVDPSGFALNVLWPLGHYSERDGGSSFAVRALPFFDRKINDRGDWLSVGGVLYRRHEDFSKDTLVQWAPLPLVRWRSSPSGTLAFAIPFFYRRDDTTSAGSAREMLIVPSYYSEAVETRWRQDDMAYEEAETETHLWPFFGLGETARDGKNPDGTGGVHWEERRYSTLFPFFQLHRSTGSVSPDSVKTDLDAPWPVLHYQHDLGSRDFRLFPALFAGTGPERTYTYLYPLLSVEDGPGAAATFWHHTSIFQWYGGEDEQRFRIFPLIFQWRERSDRFRSVIGPLFLFYYHALPGEGWLHFLPLGFGRWSETGSSMGIFPLYYQRDHGPERVNYWSPGRFFFLWNTLSGGDEAHWSLLWKLLEHTSSVDGDHDFRVLHRLVVVRSVKGQHELTVNPFFHTFTDVRTGKKSFSLFKFLYRSESDGGRESASLLFIPIR